MVRSIEAKRGKEEVSQRLKFFVEQVARQFMVRGVLSFSTTYYMYIFIKNIRNSKQRKIQILILYKVRKGPKTNVKVVD